MYTWPLWSFKAYFQVSTAELCKFAIIPPVNLKDNISLKYPKAPKHFLLKSFNYYHQFVLQYQL